MVDVTKYMSSGVTLDVVKSSQSKKAVIISGGLPKTMQDNKVKLCFTVEMDGNSYEWYPNKTSLKRVSAAYGKESSNWIGKQLVFEVGIVNGKEAVLASPVAAPVIGGEVIVG